MPTLNSQKFFAHIDGKTVATAYLLCGEEGFLLHRALARLVDKAVAGAPRDFNLDVFYGRDSKASDIVSQAETMPMMADRRVVVVYEADKLKDNGPLKDYLKSPSPTSALILAAEDADRSKEATLSRMLPKDGVHAHFYRPSGNESAFWVGRLASEAGYKLAPDAASYMQDVLGDNLALIDSELKKLFNFAGGRKNITVADVKESVGDFGLPLVFDLVDQVADKDAGRAMETLSKLVREGEQPLFVLSMLSRHWRRLVEAKDMAGRGDGPQEIERHFRLNFKNKDRFMRQVRALGTRELRDALSLMCRTDQELKGSRLPDRFVMERLVLELSGVWRA